jgi:secreted trypsin-like serine protease
MAKYKYSTIFLMMLMLQVFSSSGFSPQREPPSKLTFVVNINMMDSAKLHKDDRIVGGSVVDSEYKYPYQALFAGDHVKCGATIINRNHAITADHCIQIDAPNKDTFVIVGHYRLSSTDVFGPDADAIFGRDLVRVERFIRYEKPNYNDYKDIAILRMKNDFMLSSRVQPACIADNLSQYYIGWDAVVTGWGATQHGTPSSSDQLREVTLKVLEPGNIICQRSGGLYSKETKICAYSRGKDSCQGDSGGPLTVTQNGKFVLIGVVSSGKGCARSAYSGIYTRISAFADWIKRNAGDVCTQDSGTSQFKPTTSTRKPIPTSTRNPILTSTRKPIFSMATMKPVNPTVSASSGEENSLIKLFCRKFLAWPIIDETCGKVSWVLKSRKIVHYRADVLIVFSMVGLD